MTSDGATYTLTAKYEGFEADGPDTARYVARLLYVCRDQSMVVQTYGARLRGSESRTADVYPPHKHPRIHIEA